MSAEKVLDALFLAALERRPDGEYRHPKEDIATVLGIACLCLLGEVERLPPQGERIVRWLVERHDLRGAATKEELIERLERSLRARPIAGALAAEIASALAPHGPSLAAFARWLGQPPSRFEPRTKGNGVAIRTRRSRR
jgi:hypothetical protein